MALTYRQIVNLSCQVAKCPGFATQAGQMLNAILNELCETYNISAAFKTTIFQSNAGAGPYVLPADYLRACTDEVFWTLNGVPYPLTSIDLSEYDILVQTPGFQSFPDRFATDVSLAPPVMYLYPPANGSYPVTVRYWSMMPVVANPETNDTVPWFQFSNYLKTRLIGELCQITGDDRAPSFLGSDDATTPMGAGVLLARWLKLAGDDEGRAITVELDRRRFRGSFRNLPNTKLVGW